ncbi:MAG TPA: DUF1573 domain-containing protein [Vicinamibacteria bacterium]|nr:DUF1573 domain-containing protein [Vicinamibacteria bacterium]
MRRRRASLGAALLVLACAAGADEKPPAPRIRVEPEGFDFGNALPGKILRKDFTIRNFGNAALLIESASTTCGCTAALPEERRIEPGGSTPLRVTFETRRYSGKVERRVLLRSNDPDSPLVEVRVSATVGEGTAKK